MTKVRISGQIKVTIDEINVDDGGYEIHFKYSTFGNKWESDMYSSDFDGWTTKEWERELKQGEAIKLALQQVVDNLD